MANPPKERTEQHQKIAQVILNLGDRFDKLAEQAERGAIGVRTTLARELQRLTREFDDLKKLGVDVRRKPVATWDGQYLEFESKCRALEKNLKALQRKLR